MSQVSRECVSTTECVLIRAINNSHIVSQLPHDEEVCILSLFLTKN